MNMPQIVYLQTTTQCNGHCVYCPFDDIYGEIDPIDMDFSTFYIIMDWLKANAYCGRIGFLLHYEPTMDKRLGDFVEYARKILPDISLEIATNGIIKDPVLERFDIVNVVPAKSRMTATSRAGNVRACPEIIGRETLRKSPCPIPNETMCVAANGEVLLCCQDWRHEAVVGICEDLTSARINQLQYVKKVQKLELEICQDCIAGKTAEEVGKRLGRRFIS